MNMNASMDMATQIQAAMDAAAKISARSAPAKTSQSTRQTAQSNAAGSDRAQSADTAQNTQPKDFLQTLMQQIENAAAQQTPAQDGAMTGTADGTQINTDALLNLLKAQLEDDGSELGGEMLMEMLLNLMNAQQPDPLLLTALTEMLPQETTLISAMQSNTTVAQLSPELLQMLQAASAPQTQPAAQPTQPTQPQGFEALLTDADASAENAAVPMTMTVETQQSTTQQDGEAMENQAKFEHALYEARGAQAQPTDKKLTETTTTPLDTTAVRPQNVQTFATQHTQELADLQQTTDAEAILAQVKTGLTQGIEKAQQDFVIKLQPEGLGEITVRMAQQDGKLMINLSAANQNTQRILVNEMESLRQSMQQYNAVVQTQESSSGQNEPQLQQNLQQNFGGNANPQQQHTAQHNHYAQAEDAEDAQPWFGRQVLESSALDAYI